LSKKVKSHVKKTTDVDWKYIMEKAFEKMPNWWPRAYLAALALVNFRGKARPAMLRIVAEKQGIAYRTILRGLNRLIDENLVMRRDNEYVLKEEAHAIIVTMLKIMDEFNKEAELILSSEESIKKLEAYYDQIKIFRDKSVALLEKAHIKSEFLENLFSFIRYYIAESLEHLAYLKRTAKLIKEISTRGART